MSEMHKCATCGKESRGGHLCSPIENTNDKCDWCGSMILNRRHVCKEKVSELAYICNSCGRLAVRPEDLCNPSEITK